MLAYHAYLDETLKPAPPHTPLVLDLFAGCGGLALGFEACGFATVGFEKNPEACATYNRNLAGQCHHVNLTLDTPLPRASIIIGGPPCQPFSVGGHQLGINDPRNGIPIFLRAVEQNQPDIWILENVRGLLYRNHWYFQHIIQQMRGLGYIVDYRLLNAARFGVPQSRERLFIVGHRGRFAFPASIGPQVTVADAIGDTALLDLPEAKFLTPSMDTYIAKYERASKCSLPRDLHLDKVARTITCRNLAGATGDMLRVRLPDGRRRRLVVREGAWLQSFPGWFEFSGSETAQYNQIGNAVPPLLAYRLAQSVRAYLDSTYRIPAHILSEAAYVDGHATEADQMEFSFE